MRKAKTQQLSLATGDAIAKPTGRIADRKVEDRSEDWHPAVNVSHCHFKEEKKRRISASWFVYRK